MADNLSRIVQFFQSKGLPDYIIAGIVGNLSVESHFDPTAYNPGEGAIGLVQWEDGRRSALQAWASQHGGTETDLNIQLSFLWHEMHTSESAAWQRVQQTSNVQQAAAAWDSYYERSDGSTHQDRIDRAVEFANTGELSSSNNTGGGNAPMSGGGGSGGGSADLTKADFQSVDALGNLLDSVPALKQLVNQAMNQGWSLNRFENAVENSDWWKNHSDTARQVLIQQANDPASYQQSLTQAIEHVRQLAQQSGFSGLDHDTIASIAKTAMLTGQTTDDAWLTRQLGNNENYSNIHDKGLGNLDGQMASNVQQLESLASAYGMKLDPSELAHRAKLITMGVQTLDGYKQQAIQFAQSAFPSFAKQLADGQTTMRDIASPYVASASQLLELDPAKFDLYNPLIRKGLQGTSGKPGEPPSSMPLWQFEDMVRQDPRWQYTKNANQQMASMALQLGQAWGFNG